jgi:cytochrome c peroxidase
MSVDTDRPKEAQMRHTPTAESPFSARRIAAVSLAVAATFTPHLSLTQQVSDSDADGVPDQFEAAYGLNVAVKDNDIFANNRLFVAQQYRDFLSREADVVGANFWLTQFAAGASRQTMVESFLAADEFQGSAGAVSRLYIAVFRRLPDTAGLAFWFNAFTTNPTPQNLQLIATRFAESPEFLAIYGNLGNADFVAEMYRNILGRNLDATGAAFWRGQLNAGVSRGQVLLAFTESAEYRARIDAENFSVTATFALLRRAPLASTHTEWLATLAQGGSKANLVQGVLASDEYRTRFLPAVSTVPTTPTPAGPTVASALTIDLNVLPNYANPVLPRFYDATLTSNTPANNPVTDRGATLGRVLFYDKNLSINNAVSCSSCHQQAAGFADNQRFSMGFDGGLVTGAHSMRVVNSRFYAPGSMFWDKRAATLEAQATQPIQNAVEMGFDAAHGGFAAVITKLSALPYYRELFTWVYGDATVTEDRVQRAIAQFERSIVSTQSRFDVAYGTAFNANQPQRGLLNAFPGFSAEEERGKQLFVQGVGQGGAGCAACHVPPSFALAANSRSNGLDAGETRIFKSPALKHVAGGGPYMHDGRFATLQQVVAFYNNGIQNGPALDNRLRNGNNPQRLNLSAADQAALVAFMRTLDDPILASDPKFSDPFRR